MRQIAFSKKCRQSMNEHHSIRWILFHWYATDNVKFIISYCDRYLIVSKDQISCFTIDKISTMHILCKLTVHSQDLIRQPSWKCPHNFQGFIQECGIHQYILYMFQYQFLSEILRWRAQTTPDHILFSLISAKVRPVLNVQSRFLAFLIQQCCIRL